MSDKLLNALMQLFALIASPVPGHSSRKPIVESFLKEQFNKEIVDYYLQKYEKYYKEFQIRQTKSGKNKIIAVSSVKLLKICDLINKELTLRQKFIVLIRLLEFIKAGKQFDPQEYEFVETVAESFYIDKQEFKNLAQFVFSDKIYEAYEPNKILIINAQKEDERQKIGFKHLQVPQLFGEIYFYNIQTVKLDIFKFYDEKEIYLNQQLLVPDRIYIMTHGAAIRNPRITPIYYSDIISAYTFDKIKTKIVFEADRVSYQFKDGKIGIHELSFTERSGKLVGIMGASGSGKTTLLNVLSGIYTPTTGHILINGLDIHKDKDKLKGIIGYVSQDDLLIEELTVFENLYFNAKLCFGDYNNLKITKLVINILKELGLYEIKDMKVGTVLNRKISGGQRKRLNIALELIREPPILFLDEPTSGLSSRDSENIMDLLKDLTLKGKLIFVVIHQPSSDIFKMFDRIMILDHGGYLIYDGPPLDAIVYFKSAVSAADWSDSLCPVCGTVKPEQIFNIVEARVLDEYGKLTSIRKISPKEWYDKFRDYQAKQRKRRSYLVRKLPEIPFKIPSRFKQFKVFLARDILSKISNIQYVLINLLETPALALILTYIIRYWDQTSRTAYTLLHNDNLPVYLFMSVIIALFVGVTVSAQEITKDSKIRARERFLDLSRFSYLMAKVVVLFLISAYQSLVYVIIGNSIIGINEMFFKYWLMLFSVWFFANLLGLNISDAFKNVVNIYIIIPFLIIPQLILSGVLVSFQKLNPQISAPSHIPWYGELMTAKWAYEALAVIQFRDNKYNKELFPYDKVINQCQYITAFWCGEMINKINEVIKYQNDPSRKQQVVDNLKLIYNELTQHKWTSPIPMNFNPKNLLSDKISMDLAYDVKDYILRIKSYYQKLRKQYSDAKDQKIYELQEIYNNQFSTVIKEKYHNEKLEEFVCDKNSPKKIVEYNHRLYRYYYPIYYEPEHYFFTAHFYAPVKPFFGYKMDTYWFNLLVIWFQTLTLFITLYYRLLRALFEIIELINKKFKTKKETLEQLKKPHRNRLRRKILRMLIAFAK